MRECPIEAPVSLQALQDKLAASGQRVTELETQLSSERERATSAEEHGRTVERQLAEEQQDSARLAKKREESEAELAAQVCNLFSQSRFLKAWYMSSCCDRLCSFVQTCASLIQDILGMIWPGHLVSIDWHIHSSFASIS